MPQTRTSGRGQANRHTHPKRSLWKRLYVTVLLAVLPLVLKAFRLSRKVRSEGEYIGEGFTLALAIDGTAHRRDLAYRNRTWHAAKESAKPDLTISFRDLDYAYDIFSGALTLKDGLSARLFTTHGPNDKGVAVTYLFTIILKSIFGWRASYRR